MITLTLQSPRKTSRKNTFFKLISVIEFHFIRQTYLLNNDPAICRNGLEWCVSLGAITAYFTEWVRNGISEKKKNTFNYYQAKLLFFSKNFSRK